MPTDPNPTAYKDAFLARTKMLREDKGWTAEEMATALGVPAHRYRKYETRSPMPHDLLERFALITGVSVNYLVTGSRFARGPESTPPRSSKRRHLSSVK